MILAFFGIFLLAFFGVATVGVDLGHIAFTASELQAVADASATSGARALILGDDPYHAARVLAAANQVDGHPAVLAPGDIEVGSWHGAFVPGDTPENAVRVTAVETVDNMWAGIFGSPTTTVERRAVAAASGNRSARPVCPIVVDRCMYGDYQAGSCADLPHITQVPSTTDNSGWTSLSTRPASAATLQRFLPAECGGGGLPAPEVTVGQLIALGNGQETSTLKTIKDCWEQGLLTECVVPVVDLGCSGQFNQTSEVVGFAAFTITGVRSQGANKRITLDGICKADEPGAPGGLNLGVVSVSLVE